MQVRDAIMDAGGNLHKPVNFREQMMRAAMDDDVNQSLLTLLAGSAQVGER